MTMTIDASDVNGWKKFLEELNAVFVANNEEENRLKKKIHY